MINNLEIRTILAVKYREIYAGIHP